MTAHEFIPSRGALPRPTPEAVVIPAYLPTEVYADIGSRVVGAFEVAQLAGQAVSMETLARIVRDAISKAGAA